MQGLSSDFAEIQQGVLKRDREHDLQLAEAERELTKLLPIDKVGPGTDLLLSHPISVKVISEHVWRGLASKGHIEPDLTDVVVTAARIVFSGRLRAHMHFEATPAT